MLRLEGYARTEELADFRMAWLGSLVVKALTGQTLSASDLLGRELKYLQPDPNPNDPTPAKQLAMILGQP